MSNLSSVAQNRDLVQNSIVVNIQNPQPGTGVADPNPNPVVPAGQSDVVPVETGVAQQPKKTGFAEVKTVDEFIDTFKKLEDGKTTDQVRAEDAQRSPNAQSLPVGPKGVITLYKRFTDTERQADKYCTDSGLYDKDVGDERDKAFNSMKGAYNFISDDIRTDNADTHRDTLKKSADGLRTYHEGWNGKKWLCFRLKSGDKVATHEYANGARILGKLGKCFLHLDESVGENGEINLVNKITLDTFVDQLEFERVKNTNSDQYADGHVVKNGDAGYRFTHVNKKSSESDPKDLNALKIETVGGTWWKFWEKPVAKRTGMNDLHHMAAIRANFASAVYDELSCDGVTIPEKILNDFVGQRIIKSTSAGNVSNQNESHILRKSEVAATVDKLTKEFTKNGGRDLFAQYVDENLSGLLAETTHIRCTSTNYKDVLRNILPDDKVGQWEPNALFDEIGRAKSQQIADIRSRYNQKKAEAKQARNFTQEVKLEHQEAAEVFKVYLDALSQKLGQFKSLVDMAAVESDFQGLVSLAQNPSTFNDQFVIIKDDSRQKLKKVLRNAIEVNIKEVKDEGIRNQLMAVFGDWSVFDRFCEKGKDGTDFLALELQRIALGQKKYSSQAGGFKFTGEILNEIARTAMEFVVGYHNHLVQYKSDSNSEYAVLREKTTMQTNKVVDALTKYIAAQTERYLGEYKKAATDKNGTECKRLQDEYSSFCKTVLPGDKKTEPETPTLLSLHESTKDKKEEEVVALVQAEVSKSLKKDGVAFQLVNVNQVFDRLLEQRYLDFFRERMYTGVDLVVRLQADYAKSLQEHNELKEQEKSVRTLLDDEKLFVGELENVVSDLKGLVDWQDTEQQEYENRYPQLLKECPKLSDAKRKYNDAVECLNQMRASVESRAKQLEEIQNKKFEYKCTLEFGKSKVQEELKFENYLKKDDLQQGFNKEMMATLGRIYAALTTFQPIKEGQYSLNDVLGELLVAYTHSIEMNGDYTSGYKPSAPSSESLKDPGSLGTFKGMIGNFQIGASKIANALDICVGSKSKTSTFLDKFDAVYQAVVGHSFGHDGGADNIRDQIKIAIGNFGYTAYSAKDPHSLFSGLYNNWIDYLVSQHNRLACDLFDDLLTLSETTKEEDIVDALKSNYANSQTVTSKEGSKDLAKTFNNVQEQILKICQGSLKGVSTNFRNFFEHTLVFSAFSGETYKKAKNFRNSLTNMSDAQLWKMCSGEFETTDGQIPAQYSQGSGNNKQFRQTMEAICEYRFITKSLQAMKDAIYSFTEVLPSYQDEFLCYKGEKDKVGNTDIATFYELNYTGGRFLNNRGLDYLKGQIDRAVDAVLSEEIGLAANALATGNQTKPELVKKEIENKTNFCNGIANTVLQVMVVGELYDLDTLNATHHTKTLDQIGNLYKQEGNAWLAAKYPHLSKIYGNDCDKLLAALRNGIMTDFCNASILKKFKTRNGPIFGQWRQLEGIVTNELQHTAPKQILKFLDEVEHTLVKIEEEGRDFFIANYKSYIEDKQRYELARKQNSALAPLRMPENAAQFQEIAEILDKVDEKDREAVLKRLVGQAVQRQLLKDLVVGDETMKSINYSKFESYRKSFTEKMKIYFNNNHHEFIKGVASEAKTLLQLVQSSLSKNNQKLAEQIQPEKLGDSFSLGLSDDKLKFPALNSRIDSKDVDKSKKLMSNRIGQFVSDTADADSDTADADPTSSKLREEVSKVLGNNAVNSIAIVRQFAGGVADDKVFSALMKEPGLKVLAQACVDKVHQDVLNDPVRCYDLLAKNFKEDLNGDSAQIGIGLISASIRDEAAKMLLRLLPRYIELKRRVDADLERKMVTLEKHRKLIGEDAWKAAENEIKAAAQGEMVLLVKNFAESFKEKQGELQDEREKEAIGLIREKLDLKEGDHKDLELYAKQFALVHDLEVENAVLDQMADEVVKSVSEGKDAPLLKLGEAVRQKVENRNKLFIKNHADAFKGLSDKVATLAKSCGLNVTSASQFREFVEGIMLKDKDNKLLDNYVFGTDNPDDEGLKLFADKIGGAFRTADLTVDAFVDAHAYLKEDSGVKTTLQAFVASGDGQKLLLAALKQRLVEALPEDVGQKFQQNANAVEGYSQGLSGKCNELQSANDKRIKYVKAVGNRVEDAFDIEKANGLFGATIGAFDWKETGNGTHVLSNEKDRPKLERMMRELGMGSVMTFSKTDLSLENIKVGWAALAKEVVASAKGPLARHDFQAKDTVEKAAARLVRDAIRAKVEVACRAEADEIVSNRIKEESANGLKNITVKLDDDFSLAAQTFLVEKYCDKTNVVYNDELNARVENILSAVGDVVASQTGGASTLKAVFDDPVVEFSKIRTSGEVPRLEDTFALAQLLNDIYSEDDLEKVDEMLLWSKERNEDTRMTLKGFVKDQNLDSLRKTARVIYLGSLISKASEFAVNAKAPIRKGVEAVFASGEFDMRLADNVQDLLAKADAVDKSLLGKQGGYTKISDAFKTLVENEEGLFPVSLEHGSRPIVLIDKEQRNLLVNELKKSMSVESMLSGLKDSKLASAKETVEVLEKEKSEQRKFVDGQFTGDSRKKSYVFSYGAMPNKYSGKVIRAELAGIKVVYPKLKSKYMSYHVFTDVKVADEFLEKFGPKNVQTALTAKNRDPLPGRIVEVSNQIGVLVKSFQPPPKNANV